MGENRSDLKISGLEKDELKTESEQASVSTEPLLAPSPDSLNSANGLQLNKTGPDSIDGQLLTVPTSAWNRIEKMEVAIPPPSDLTLCGLGVYRPSWLQRFSTKTWMLFWLCWFCFVQGMLVNGFVPSILSTIERRFVFSSAILGRIMQFYDIGYVICCIPVSYFGGRHSKPLFLASGILIMGIGSFLFSMPHMVSDNYEYIDKAEDLGSCSRPNETMVGSAKSLHGSKACNETEAVAAAAMASSNRFFYEVLFCLAHLLHGIGATPLFTLGVSYIDENVKPALSSMYIGVFYTFVILGPAAGFVLSSLFLRYHTDYFNQERPTDGIELDESDHNWIGNWWFGFLISSFLALLAVLPILSFPKVLPAAVDIQRSRLQACRRKGSLGQQRLPPSESRDSIDEKLYEIVDYNPGPSGGGETFRPPRKSVEIEEKTLIQKAWRDVKHIPAAVSRLLLNPCYMFINLAAAVDGIMVAGFSTFMAKYLERQFSVPSSRANLLIGFIMVPVAGFGTLMSGYIVKRFSLNVQRTMKFCISVCLFSLVLTPMFLVYCEPMQLVGVQTHYPPEQISVGLRNGGSIASALASEPATDSKSPQLINSCNKQCRCSLEKFQPVCGISNGDPVTYFNPCLAGCPEDYHPLKKQYANCTCSATNSTVNRGACESNCAYLTVFLVLFAPMVLATFSIGVPMLSVILRCVDYHERSFALGIQWILIRCIGTIPSPALFGWLFDVACLKWGTEVCGGERGNCYIYDNKMLSNLFLVLGLICQSVTLMFLVLALVTYRGDKEEGMKNGEKEEPVMT